MADTERNSSIYSISQFLIIDIEVLQSLKIGKLADFRIVFFWQRDKIKHMA